MNLRFLARALLAPAVVAAAFALAGCDQDAVTSGRALAPLSDKMVADLDKKHMDKDSPILIRLFKEESELEVWKKNRDGEYALLKTYPICRWSGDLGPKKREGDRQAPEGFYSITPAQMNPNSNYYLAFNTGFPNTYDRAWGYTGSELMVHGDCSSRGCYAMTDEQIQEIYALARESFFGGQKEFQFEAFPFRMTAMNMARHRNNPNFAFWKMLKEGYDHFEATHQEPVVAVCERHYVFDAAAPDNATRPLKFDPRGKCPAYQLNKNIADAVLEKQRHEQYLLAQDIADRVALAPPHVGDGGMNPVFAQQLATHDVFDNNGHVVQVAGNEQAPGALPHVPNAPGAFAALHPPKPAPASVAAATPAPTVVASAADTAAAPETEEAAMTSVPIPEAAPLPKDGQAPRAPTTIADVLGTMFNGEQPKETPAVAQTESQPVALRGSEDAAKSKQAVTRVAARPATPHPHAVVAREAPRHAAPVKYAARPAPKAAAAEAPSARPSAAQVQPRQAEQAPPPAHEMRTAYSAAQPASNGLLSGAQPVMPTGSFDARWSALR